MRKSNGDLSSPAGSGRQQATQFSEVLTSPGAEGLVKDRGDDGAASGGGGRERANSLSKYQLDLDGADDEQEPGWCCDARRERMWGVKVDTLLRLIEVCTAFPFVIVVSALNLSNSYTFLRCVRCTLWTVFVVDGYLFCVDP